MTRESTVDDALVEDSSVDYQHRYSELIRIMKDSVFIIDLEGIHLEANQSWGDFLGFKLANVIGKSIWNFIPEEFHDECRVVMGSLLAGKEIPLYTREFLKSDGTRALGEMNVSLIVDSQKNSQNILGVVRDVTEIKEAKDKITESEVQYRLLYENLSDGLYQADLKGYITMASKRGAEIFNKSPEEIIGSHISEVIHPSNRERLLAEYQESIKKGKSNSEGIEVRGIRDDDSPFFFQVKNTIVLENGKPIGMQGLVREITEHKLAQLALEDSEQRYRSFVENFQGIAYRGSLGWVPEFFHGAVESITGYLEEDFVAGTPRWDEVIHPEDKEYVYEIGADVRTIPNHRVERQYRIIKKDGEICWVREYIQNISDVSGTPRWVQGAIYDITDMKHVEQALTRAYDDLQLYASLLQHDLRNDLQVILNRSEVAQVIKTGDSEATEKWKTIQATVLRMIRLLDVFIEPSSFEERNILKLVEFVADQAKNMHPNLSIKVDADEESREFQVAGSRLLPCVFDNLFRNVVDHVGANAKINVKIRTKGRKAIIDISDDGPGVPKELRSRLFLKGVSSTGGGYGLYLSAKIVNAYGGTIEFIDNKVGGGSLFQITLPSI